MAGGLANTFGGFGESGAPGFVPPTASSLVGPGAGLSAAAMHNRYQQLGLGDQGGGPGTAERMDLGQAPSVTGGIPAQFAAVLGELTNASLRQSPSGTGKQNPASQAGSILSAFSK